MQMLYIENKNSYVFGANDRYLPYQNVSFYIFT